MTSLQINLLPEARILKLQAMARKRMFTTITIVVAIVFGTVAITLILLLGYMYSVNANNTARIKSLKNDISKNHDMEQGAATLQQNLAAFVSQNSARLFVSQMLLNLGNVIPGDVKITNFQITGSNQVTVTGTAPSYASVAILSKSLQEYNLNFKPQANLDRKALFTNVQITSVTKQSGSGGEAVNFTMTFNVDPILFSKNGTSTQ
jgi:Tfp pilus assembly protein PilN